MMRIQALKINDFYNCKYTVNWYKPSKGALKQDNYKYFKGKVKI